MERRTIRSRNPVREWTRAMDKRGAMNMDVMEPLVARSFEHDMPVATDDVPAWLRGSRDLAPATTLIEASGQTIRVLQRGNTLLRRRFGIDWADAAGVVFVEAQRRGASPVALARVLTAGLRRDAKGRGA